LNAVIGVPHVRTGLPSTSTVQAPQIMVPQEYFVPVRPRVSRNTHSSGVSSLTSNSRTVPLTVSFLFIGALLLFEVPCSVYLSGLKRTFNLLAVPSN
jgi:hypothetical protein